LLLLAAQGCAPTGSQGTGDGGTHQGTGNPAPITVVDDLVKDLVKSGWSREPAVAVAQLNRDWFNLLARDDPVALERQFKLLRGLGRHPQLFDLLERHPEVSGLLAQAEDSIAVAECLRSEQRYRTAANLFVRHVAPSDAAALARAMSRHGELIDRLVGRGLTGAEVLFMHPEDDAGDREYALWLDDFCHEASDLSDDELAQAVGIALIHGADLRHRLQKDAAFREDFREKLWPRYSRMVARKVIGPETFAYATKIWDFLRLEQSELLLQRWGLMAVNLLYGTNAFPLDLHPQLVRLMLRADNAKIQALYENRSEPLLFAILRRPNLSDSTRLAFLDRLKDSGNKSAQILAEFSGYDGVAFAEELKPPASGPVTWVPLYYTVYEVPRKAWQGRPISIFEIVQAAADPIFLLLPGSGGAEEGGKGILKTILAKQGRSLAARQIEKEVAEQIAERELAPWLLDSALTGVQQHLGRKLGSWTNLEITAPVRLFFECSGLGRESFKRLTGLEARLFMRRDSAVFICLGPRAPVVAARFLGQTAELAGIDIAVNSGPGGAAIQAIGAAATGRDAAKGASDTWQKHISAWWLMNAGGNRSHPESGCILNKLPGNPWHFSVNPCSIVNASCAESLISLTVVNYRSYKVFINISV